VVVKTATISLQLELDWTVYMGESLRGRKEGRGTLIQIKIIWLYSPSRALASPSWCFLTITFFTGLHFYSSAPPPTWRTRPPYLWPPETDWLSYTPRHYSLIPATTREPWYKQLPANPPLAIFSAC
jgi:hypothetical protein